MHDHDVTMLQDDSENILLCSLRVLVLVFVGFANVIIGLWSEVHSGITTKGN
jgi:hypothetical protein